MSDRAHVEQATRDAIVIACRRLHARGLLAGTEGNISVRLPSGDLLITPGGADKATLRADMMICVRRDGTLCHDAGAEGDTALCPSSELGMHRACYDARPDVGAVVHAHPPVATGFATAGMIIPDDALQEMPACVGPIALVPYARTGTEALSSAIKEALPAHDTFLLANHGVTTVGATLEAAMFRMESVEQGARIILVAQLLGGVRAMPRGEREALAEIQNRERTGDDAGHHT